MLEAATLALVEEQANQLRELGPAANVRAVEQRGQDVYVTFLRKRDAREYVIRFRCDDFPIAPPSVHFVDATTLADSGPGVWPSDGEQGVKRNSTPRFICLPGTREYYEHGHGPIPLHKVTLSVVFQHIAQAIEARG